jgi:hypothetical protein
MAWFLFGILIVKESAWGILIILSAEKRNLHHSDIKDEP